ncbi:MAG: hypothetical protein AAGI25_13605 [Bacteroidota bacterium]
MRILNSKKTIKNYTWATMLLTGAISFGIISCSDDDNTDVNSDGQEMASAWWTSYRIQSPQGNIWYLRATEEIPEDFNASSAVELGLEQRVVGFEDHPYVYNPSAQTITKWAVDRTDLSLSVEGILSLAATGISAGLVVNPTIISESQAFIHDLEEGLIVEWNPEDMTITEIHQVEPLEPIQATGFAVTDFTYVRGDKIILPIWQSSPTVCCDINTADLGAQVAVFDINTKVLEYKRDTRLLNSWFNGPTDENGSVYIRPAQDNPFNLKYFDVDPNEIPSPHTLLRLYNNGNFDPNFSFDLDEVLDVGMINDVSYIFDNKAYVTYWDSTEYQLLPEFDNRWDIRSNPVRRVSVDLITKEVKPFTALDKYAVVLHLATIEGSKYYLGVPGAFGSNESHYLRQESFTEFIELGTYEGAVSQMLGKLW